MVDSKCNAEKENKFPKIKRDKEKKGGERLPKNEGGGGGGGGGKGGGGGGRWLGFRRGRGAGGVV